ncbi:hypothetical protein [Devosia sp. SD17-2]|uniref:hypothetical protein n=1 Tax=Devosia sp. SD17-2 TaxID=2976459 RepID=UPI0023D7BD36|nr:hypothetical protein [Devosia sp. SD17-2]WEJ33472.1 hypothetical protein NYQ88_01215 [Devosia sp. SD17-2]
MRKTICMATGMMALALMAAPALAQSGFTSAYTDFNLDECLVLEADDFGAEWACPGYKGFPMLVREGDLHFAVAFGFNPDANVVGFQTLPPFNYIAGKVEWRLSNASGRWMPVATIMRYFTDGMDDESDEGQILVVTQIADGNSCHIAHIDARANKNANELARQAADAAGDFDCASDEAEIIGAFGAY